MQFTIVTAVTENYLPKLQWAAPSWVYKPQLRNKPVIVYHHGISRLSKLNFMKELFNDIRFIEWDFPKAESISEKMFSAFIFGAIRDVKTSHYLKLDADSYCYKQDDIFTGDDFDYDLVGNRWGYTKPGWFVTALDNWYDGTDKFLDKQSRKSFEKRIASYCCLHKTEWVKKVAAKFGDRLPVPSHDTSLWYMANREGKWRGKGMNRLGVMYTSTWKSIREAVCSGDPAFNPLMNKWLFKNVQIEITSKCNLGCYQCDRNCGVVPGKEMSVAQIYRFVEESIEMNRQWSRIDIIGGEPTLHSKLPQVFDMIKIYKDKYPKCKIRFSTNGYGDKVNEIIKTIPEWVHIRNSSKTCKSQEFTAYHCAPIDAGEKEIKACSVPWRCGVALTKYGYFPCGAGASLAKVFGLDIGKRSLKEFTPDDIKEQMCEICKYCGHSNCKSRKITNKEEMSKSWEAAIKNYDENKMSIF